MQDEAGPSFGEATLTDCDREPIHIPGSIQPHGCLLAVDDHHRIVQCAGDHRTMLGVDADDPLGLPLSALVGEDAARRLVESGQAKRARPLPLKTYEIEIETPSGPIDAILHEADGQLVIEFEHARRSTGGMNDTLLQVQRMLAALETAPTVEAYYQTCADQIRQVTGFDRVMVYRFLDDGSGKVTAEAKQDELESYLDLHYPESDIPKQARELYCKNWIRIIPDINYTPAPIEPETNPVTGRPLDLTFSSLRSVSPLHLQYLRNMGVAASMSVSIVHRGALWGLIACHHRQPHHLPCDVRAACEMFGHVFSLQLETRLHAQDYEYRLQQRSVHQQLVARLSSEESLSDGLIRFRPNLLDLIQADGVAVWVDGGFSEIGWTPGQAGVQHLTRLLNARGEEGVVSTDRLTETFPEAVLGDVAGVLALSVSRSPKDWILWFRRELVDTVTWAGNPNKAVVQTTEEDQLSPRASFRAWRETVRGRSRPWKTIEIEAAQTLRLSILEVVLKRIDLVARERAEAQERQALLVAELDHRVKNTLATVQALMRHTRRSDDTLEGYVRNLDRRIRAMAYAQSLLSASRWRGAELRCLVEQELRHFEGPPRRIRVAGPTIELAPKAALAIGMVVHELATNAAKYGALSTSGSVDVAWRLEDDALALTWREHGGPAVRTPQRRGFGRMLIETSLGYELEGEADLRFEEMGVTCDMRIPLRFVLAADPQSPETTAGTRAADVGPMSVLVVEDSMLTALDIAESLQSLGYEVLGPTGRVADALRLVERDTPDLAVLDINLGDETSLAIADRLVETGTPFLFLSGYDAKTILPPRFVDAPCLAKPFSDDTLAATLERARSGVPRK
ncbi:MAG: HWE histidine kinase domain-containing protein [Pseudomonadota bacterium]